MAYPVTNELRLSLNKVLREGPKSGLISDTDPEFSRNRIVDVALEYIGEYEHGSVDIEDALGVKSPFEDLDPESDADERYVVAMKQHEEYLRMTASVLGDFVQTLFAIEGGQ